MAFEKVARVFFDYGVEMFVCCGERVERVGGEGGIEGWLGVGEYAEENLRRETGEIRHLGWCCCATIWGVSGVATTSLPAALGGGVKLVVSHDDARRRARFYHLTTTVDIHELLEEEVVNPACISDHLRPLVGHSCPSATSTCLRRTEHGRARTSQKYGRTLLNVAYYCLSDDWLLRSADGIGRCRNC